MSIVSNKELAENKLILLYIIDKVNIPISNLQITKIILENKFMNYFMLQQLLNELCTSNYLLYKNIDNKAFYTITPLGETNLKLLYRPYTAGYKKPYWQQYIQHKEQHQKRNLYFSWIYLKRRKRIHRLVSGPGGQFQPYRFKGYSGNEKWCPEGFVKTEKTFPGNIQWNYWKPYKRPELKTPEKIHDFVGMLSPLTGLFLHNFFIPKTPKILWEILRKLYYLVLFWFFVQNKFIAYHLGPLRLPQDLPLHDTLPLYQPWRF